MNNKIELIGHYGGDEQHAMAAWTSTSTELTDERRARIPKLLKSLAVDKHMSPFEHSTLTFRVTSDIASHIHFLRHRVGVSFNVESARYKELIDDKYYVPGDWPEEEKICLEEHCERCFKMYHKVLKRLEEKGFSWSRAKESSRLYLPYASQLTFIVTMNFRTFMHFLGLRYSIYSQKEICDISKSMLLLVKGIENTPFKYSIEAFGYGEEV